MEFWARQKLTKFDEDKHKFLHLGRKKSLPRYKLGTDCLGNSFGEKDPEVFVGQQAELPV